MRGAIPLEGGGISIFSLKVLVIEIYISNLYFRKIVPSVEYFAEEKFEFKRPSKKSINDEETSQVSETTSESEKPAKKKTKKKSKKPSVAEENVGIVLKKNKIKKKKIAAAKKESAEKDVSNHNKSNNKRKTPSTSIDSFDVSRLTRLLYLWESYAYTVNWF